MLPATSVTLFTDSSVLPGILSEEKMEDDDDGEGDTPPTAPEGENLIVVEEGTDGQDHNLTQIGTLDRMAFAAENWDPSKTARKANAAQENQIQYERFGNTFGNVIWSHLTASWTDGTSPETVNQHPTGISAREEGGGFKLTIPAAMRRDL